ncbi:MAG: SsrA-binding protein SmpB [Candidatus Omnitrophica bacterium]|nr:SsrA-binding protein SmpB [Candidatus Omnitrophota bacterium]
MNTEKEKKKNTGFKVVATNRKARKEYHILEVHEAGIALCGTEVKSLRVRGCSIEGSFGRLERGEAYLYNMHIPEFEKSYYFKPEPTRVRKLLLHKQEIERFIGFTIQRGVTIIPLRVYFNDRGIAKVEIALAKGRLLYDKRRKIKEEMADREAERELKKFKHLR